MVDPLFIEKPLKVSLPLGDFMKFSAGGLLQCIACERSIWPLFHGAHSYRTKTVEGLLTSSYPRSVGDLLF